MAQRARGARLRAIACLVTTVLVVAPMSTPVAQGGGPAAPLAPAVIAVVDYQRLMRESEAALSIRGQVEARRDDYETELASERARLEAADRELNEARLDLSVEVYRERRQAFEGDVAQVQRLVQQRRQQLDEASGEAFQTVRDAIVDIIADLGDTYRFNIVLSRSDVLVFAPEVDLTAVVLETLNTRLPEVAIPEFED